MTTQSETIEVLAAALAKAQSEFSHAAKSAENPHFGSRYADLAAVWDACRAALTSNGLAVTQTTRLGKDGPHVLVTTLLHASGQWLSSEMPILDSKNNSQSFGSALTYARRYSLAAMVGVSQDDDDGEGGMGRGFAGGPRQAEPARAAKAVERTPESSRQPKSATAVDPAHAALVAQFKADVAAVKDAAGFAPIAASIDAASLPKPQLDDARAELAVYGLKFAADAEDLDFWVGKLNSWELPKESEPYERASEAFEAAEGRIERDAITNEGKAA